MIMIVFCIKDIRDASGLSLTFGYQLDLQATSVAVFEFKPNLTKYECGQTVA